MSKFVCPYGNDSKKMELKMELTWSSSLGIPSSIADNVAFMNCGVFCQYFWKYRKADEGYLHSLQKNALVISGQLNGIPGVLVMSVFLYKGVMNQGHCHSSHCE